MANQKTFHTQPEFNLSPNRVEEPAHQMRSIGNAVGKRKFANSNRPGHQSSTRRLNRKARAHGFASHKAFVEHLSAIMALEQVKHG